MAKDANTILQKYQTRVAGAGTDYVNGVQSPKRDWLQAFTAAQPRMQAGLQAAIASGKIVRRAQAKGGTANWQQKAASKGARNYTAAAADAAKGYAEQLPKIQQAADAARAAANALPDTTIEQRMQRAIAAMTATSKVWGGGKS